MKKYIFILLLGLFFLANVSTTNATTIVPTIKITSPVETGETQVDVEVTNFNTDMDGDLVIEIGDYRDQWWISDTVSFNVPELKRGDQINISYIDESGEETLLQSATVADPLLPKLSLSTVSNKSDYLKYTITNYNERFLNGGLIAKVKGEPFESYIDKKTGLIIFYEPFKAGTKVELYYVDQNYREWYLKTLTVVDKTPPKISVSSITNRTTTFKVTSEKNSTISLKIGKKTYKGKDLKNGQYQFTISKQKVGTKIFITAADKLGNKQTKTITIKLKSGTTISMKDVTTKSTKVTGTVKKWEKGDKVVVLIGKKTYKGSIKSGGSYSVNIPKQKANTTVKVRVIDSIGNVLDTDSTRVYTTKYVEIGMTKKEVLNTQWGAPDDKNITIDSWGTWEQWIYYYGEYDAQYLYFSNGKLVSIDL
ncbi:MAG TPA: hypothetical protein VNR61_16750 [Niallia sp.]|nr:hypothetical protein [Niallia sp.]